MAVSYSYMQAIGDSFTNVQCICNGNANVYENIVWLSGDDLPSKSTLDTVILQKKKDLMWLEIQAERARRQAGGVYIQSSNKWFHSDQTSRIQQLGLVMMGSNMPNNINWKTMDGSFVTMTPALALSIFNGAATLDMTAFAVAEQHRANMNLSSTPETYDYSGFWPAIYGA